MQCFNPQKIAEWVSGDWREGGVPDTIRGFCFDARLVREGDCFVALSSGIRDGHDFVDQAVELGACAVLVERVQSVALPQLVVADSLLAMAAVGAAVRQRFTKPIVGVTGSCGKTSTKEMLRALLGEGGTHATAGNWNNRIGVPMTLFGLDAGQQEFAVIEAGINQPEEMEALGAMIRGDLTVVTNVEAAHLELLGSIENVAAEKAKLVSLAAEDSPVVLPVDVFQYSAFSVFADRAIVLVPEGEEAVVPEPRRVVRFRLEALDAGHTMLRLFDGGESCFKIASPSSGICRNAALAILAAREFGVSEAAIRSRIEAWQPSSTRGQIQQVGAQTFYVDCYNANPASMADALFAFRRAMPESAARCYVLGAMNELGIGAVDLHRAVGQALELRSQDRAFFVGPADLSVAYLEGAQLAGASDSQLQSVSNVEQIQSAVAAFEGTIFLKGSRSYALEKLLPSKPTGAG